MNYSEIKWHDIANGEGVRTSLFVSGCRVNCKDCFNKETWDFNYGQELTHGVVGKIIQNLDPYYMSGLTILGGEPMEEENQEALLPIVELIREKLPNKSIWIYTGYQLEDLLEGGKKNTHSTMDLLNVIDVLVDGKFESTLHDISLKFRGSSNQRLIDMKATLKSDGKIVLKAL